MKKKGSLVIIGTGIQLGDMGILSKSYIEKSDKLLYLVVDEVTEFWLKQLNPSAESLKGFYSENKSRMETYLSMVDKIMGYVRGGFNVCVALYGHPGIFVTPSQIAINKARNEGYRAEMLPGISAEDWLFADLGINPGDWGCQSYEATNFLLYKRKFDIRTPLILWQIGVVGNMKYNEVQPGEKKFNILLRYLLKYYARNHKVIVYEAAQITILKPKILEKKLSDLKFKDVNSLSTLFIPAVKENLTADSGMLARLGISVE
jgi:uncharacterized protein YabN with tetrapyrrole methylase and pyrophosphatase domain